MENRDEIRRLELKTGYTEVEIQALWAGLQPGMRVLDIGCGSGKTTEYLKKLSGPDGEAIGVDGSDERIAYARDNHQLEGMRFECRDFYLPLDDLGTFDFIWIRFVLEYHRSRSFDLVKAFTRLLKKEGILCLVDLDHNSLNHFDLPPRLERAIYGCSKSLQEKADFDPYTGRKLYSFFYDLSYRNIDVRLDAHHLIFGELGDVDEFNWMIKVAIAGRDSGYDFKEYGGDFDAFFNEVKVFFADPRRFTYTPVISCRGQRPLKMEDNGR
jgi:ubiquinone/menaquinone biosynthesis C-methylase UbiE